MADVSAREKVLLGYTPSPLSLSQTSSDVDFSDVFGGPPRRSSAQEFGSSKRNSIDVDNDGDADNDSNDVEDESSAWSRFRERPVFGEVAGVRRRYTSDDFFDDIFRGDQPSSSSHSPRVVPRGNLFASAPGSRVMSPSRSLPPGEQFTGAAKFSVPVCSLPGRLTNTDYIASSSMTQNSFGPSLSRFNQIIQNHDAGSSSSSHSSALPRQNSADVKESTTGTQLDGVEDQSDQLHSNMKGSEFPIHATNFHFSIYKWASKDVPLIISFRKKRGLTSNPDTKLDQCFTGCKKGVGHNIHVTVKESIKPSKPEKKSVKPSQTENEQEHYNDSFISSTTEEVKFKQEHTSRAELKPTNDIRTTNVVDKARGDTLGSSLEDAARNVTHKAVPNQKKFGNETIIAEKTGHKTGMVEEKQKQSPIDVVISHKVEKTKEPKSSSPTKNDSRRSEAKGKVKDFVKIFNKEPTSGLRQSHSRIWKDKKTVEVDYEIRFSSARMSDDMEASYVNWKEAWPDASETMFQEDGKSSETHQFTVDDSSVPNTTKQASTNEPNTDILGDSTPSTNTASNNADNMGKEAIKGYETKVSQWSKGKEGNIRALLSTLQYVLWPDSGWKPVPLVDVIEANAVKRAYQKALLRLHPDKLQQKGAPPHHKLIAEKVFDILQEAWDQFNSLGSL